MAETVGTVVGVVTFGLQLATMLQTHMEMAAEANEALHDVVFEVNATASALKQLQIILDTDRSFADKQSSSRVFKDDGVREIEGHAAKCEKLYLAIIKLVQKASGWDDDTAGTNEDFARAVLNPTSLKHMNLFRRLRWPWLAPRIKRCQEQLRWLKISLLVTLQLAGLARQQMSGEAFGRPVEEVSTTKDSIGRLQARQSEFAKEKLDILHQELDEAHTKCSIVAATKAQHKTTHRHESDAGTQQVQAHDNDQNFISTTGTAVVRAREKVGNVISWTADEQIRKLELVPQFTGSYPNPQPTIFGERDKFMYDEPSPSLVAFVAEDGNIRKVPFGHMRLQYGLTQVLESWGGTPLAKYVNETAEKQIQIAKVTDLAKRTSNRAMSLLAFHELERPDGPNAILAFFSLNETQEPLQFIDPTGQKYCIPFGAGSSYESFCDFIFDLCKGGAGLAKVARRKLYLLEDAGGSTVDPMVWHAVIHPGATIRMRIKPRSSDRPWQGSHTNKPSQQQPNAVNTLRRSDPDAHNTPSTRWPGTSTSTSRLTMGPLNKPSRSIALLQRTPGLKSGEAQPSAYKGAIFPVRGPTKLPLPLTRDEEHASNLMYKPFSGFEEDVQFVDFAEESKKAHASVDELLRRLTNYYAL